jgi:hypothetical protein
VADVAPELRRLAGAVGVDPAVADRAGPGPAGGVVVRLRAFVPIWRRPWMTLNGDTYGSSLLALIGVTNVYGDRTDRYPTVEDLDDVRARRPDVVLAPSEPYPFAERHRAELETVAPVVLVDGQDLFWWGVRTPAAVERLRSSIEGPRR